MQSHSNDLEKMARTKRRLSMLRMEIIREWLAGLAWSG